MQLKASQGSSQIQGSEDPWDALSCGSFSAKRATNYRALLRKMTYKDKALYASSPPCNHFGARLLGNGLYHIYEILIYKIHICASYVSHICLGSLETSNICHIFDIWNICHKWPIYMKQDLEMRLTFLGTTNICHTYRYVKRDLYINVKRDLYIWNKT